MKLHPSFLFSPLFSPSFTSLSITLSPSSPFFSFSALSISVIEALSSRRLSLCQLINGHSKSVWFAERSPFALLLLLPYHSPALHLFIPLAAFMRDISPFVLGPMVHLASDMRMTGTGNGQEFLRGGGGSDCGFVALSWAVVFHHKGKE